jgi:DNA-binding PadR family transcriptional regulator
MQGYELIQALSDRFGATYVPSVGTIYPRIGKLEEDGLVTKQADGRKTVYAITAADRAELKERESELDGIEAELSDSVLRLADEVRATVGEAMRTLRADLAAAARDARTEARSTGGTEQIQDPRTESRILLHEAESTLPKFRAELRADLRAEVAEGRLPAEAVALIRTRLQDVRREVGANRRSGR